MGMYTSVTDSDVKILNVEGLKEYFKDAKAGKYEYFIDKEEKWYNVDKTKPLNLAIDLIKGLKIDGDQLDFSGWDGWKIISYWYDNMCYLLRDIAVFVEGQVYLEFENHDEAGWIEFTDGKCIIHTGVMQWHEWNAETNVKQKDLPEYLKSVLVARKLLGDSDEVQEG